MEPSKMTIEICRLALSACPMPVLIESDGGLVFANESAVSLLGAKDVQSLEGIPVRELLMPENPDRQEASESYSKAKAQAFNGERIPVFVAAKTIELNATPMIAYYLSVPGDDKRGARFAAASGAAAEVLMNLRKAGHDLNQPLTIISGKSQLLMLDADESDPLYKSLKSITDASFRMGEIVQSISRMIKSLGSVD
ncbi:MAG: hypothetical protein HY788_00025 [Deltaproteobacteria bacterium]|nr:hypothetical protein [Deltaproteobacteria bacterium]